MALYIIAYDLGTGGVKASLYDSELETIAKSFIEYKTYYPHANFHEQKPSDWWDCVVRSTRILIKTSKVNAEDIKCISLSGHSLVTVPIDKDGNELLEYVPIWSDTRADNEAAEFFKDVPEKTWYMTTGNGFPAACYSIFKLMWLKKNNPDIYSKIYKVMGSKDYINYRLTGKVFTDHSYASGIGAYDLRKKEISKDYLIAAGLSQDFFPTIVPSHTIIGSISKQAAVLIGLPAGTAVVCGGVDNACMALGAVGAVSGKTYVSLGSSSWIPVNSKEPVLDWEHKPYVFAHIQENLFTSAFSIFSGGSSLQWVRNTIFPDMKDQPDAYDKMTSMASTVPIGSNGIYFNPSLAGGTSQDKSIHIRGAYIGLHLGTKREDMVRAALEGIAMNLRISLEYLKKHTSLTNEILFTGGGSKSKFWMQIFANVFDMDIIRTNIDQDAASLGAAAIAARGLGLYSDYSFLNSLYKVNHISKPKDEDVNEYKKLYHNFVYLNEQAANIGDYLACSKRVKSTVKQK